MTELSLYALDGVCHNAEPGTYGHECGKPAKFLGTAANGMTSGFCADCQKWGYEAKGRTNWRSVGNPWRVEQWRSPNGDWRGWKVIRDRDDQPPEVADAIPTIEGPTEWRIRTAMKTLAVDLNRKELAS
jgi:hypothetical protein